jgi:hypothetical protein
MLPSVLIELISQYSSPFDDLLQLVCYVMLSMSCMLTVIVNVMPLPPWIRSSFMFTHLSIYNWLL